MKNNHIITFIGAGNMASSLVGGLIADGYNRDNIWVSDPNSEHLKELQNRYHIHTTSDNRAATKKANIIIFSVKPNVIKTVCNELADTIKQNTPLIISIAAGIPENTIQHWLHNHSFSIVRCMPNTTALVRASATALYANRFVTQKQKDEAENILRSVGVVVWLDKEEHIDIVTALSGSGTGYCFLIMEILEKAATDLGLPESIAHLLTIQTFLGASKMALEQQVSLSDLRDQVTSKGGTTEAGLRVLESANISECLTQAVNAATERAKKLAEQT